MAATVDALPALASALASVLPAMVAWRHDVHAHPEPGFEEVRTHARVREALAAAGIEGGTVMATTGLVVDIVGTGPAAAANTPTCIALRADMDALRMTEGNKDLPYRSTNPNAAHMCGHDGHMAALIGAATLLAQAGNRIPKGHRVRLLFQPAEEGPGGAPPMIEAGCLDGVDEARTHLCATSRAQATHRPAHSASARYRGYRAHGVGRAQHRCTVTTTGPRCPSAPSPPCRARPWHT